jgi:hypothetical protein
MAEQFTRNEQVVGSIPTISSISPALSSPIKRGFAVVSLYDINYRLTDNHNILSILKRNIPQATYNYGKCQVKPSMIGYNGLRKLNKKSAR